MWFSVVALFGFCAGAALAAPPATTAPPAPVTDQDFPQPQIDWGKCPQLKPTEADKEQKRNVIQKCLEKNPPPALDEDSNMEKIDDHREKVTTCALETEGWFNTDKSYKFDRAKTEIQSKKLEESVEKEISQRHAECQHEAVSRYPDGYIQQVQLYQACMDYHIAETCQIELIPPPGGFPDTFSETDPTEEADYDSVNSDVGSFPNFPGSAPSTSTNRPTQ